jgi:hypothetical protein
MSAAHHSASKSKAPRPDPTNACGSSGSRRYADHEKKRDPHGDETQWKRRLELDLNARLKKRTLMAGGKACH